MPITAMPRTVVGRYSPELKNSISPVDRMQAWACLRPDDVAFTYLDYATGPAGAPRSLTWSALADRVAALAVRIGQWAAPGDRVAILAPTGLDYVVALLAAWSARAVAVPLFPPDLPGRRERLVACLADSAPACVVTTSAAARQVGGFVARQLPAATVLTTDGPAAGSVPAAAPTAPVEPDTVAYLQYTSGSTRAPAGVEITYGNLAANIVQVLGALVADRPRLTVVSWLPLFHDMGLVSSVAVPLFSGGEAVLLDPLAFLIRPERWLRLLSHRRDVVTASPNFAFDYCLRRIDPQQLEGIDLSGVRVWLNGSEPVRAGTLAAFAKAMRPTGLDPAALCPAYGLAEATVFVCADSPARPPTAIAFAVDSLRQGPARPARGGEPATTLVSCGTPAGQDVAVVDAAGRALPAGHVGELWVHGPNVARRYRGQPERSRATFGGMLIDPPPGLPAGPWLRTGDLGLLHDGAVFVTGRAKDLIIVDGRNHYPQDVEETAAEVTGALGVGRIAVFAVTVGETERAVAVCEHATRPRTGAGPDRIAETVRTAVWQRHGLALHEVLTTAPGSLPHTSSGKLSRAGCRRRYVTGGFVRTAS